MRKCLTILFVLVAVYSQAATYSITLVGSDLEQLNAGLLDGSIVGSQGVAYYNNGDGTWTAIVYNSDWSVANTSVLYQNGDVITIDTGSYGDLLQFKVSGNWNDLDIPPGSYSYNTGAFTPVGSTGTGGFVLTGTNGVYILGGTNSSIIVNDGTHPVVSQFVTGSDDWEWFSAGWACGLTFGGIAFCFRLARQPAKQNPEM